MMPSILLGSSQPPIQKPSMTPSLCGCIRGVHVQGPLTPALPCLFKLIFHYGLSQICTQQENTKSL